MLAFITFIFATQTATIPTNPTPSVLWEFPKHMINYLSASPINSMDQKYAFYAFLCTIVNMVPEDRPIRVRFGRLEYNRDDAGNHKRIVVYYNERKVFIAFRGTRKNGLHNLVPDVGSDVLLTQSFIHNLNPVEWSAVRRLRLAGERHTGKQFYLAGHSLGGYLANKAALALQTEINIRGGVFFNPGYAPCELDISTHIAPALNTGAWLLGSFIKAAYTALWKRLSPDKEYSRRFKVLLLAWDPVSFCFPYGTKELYYVPGKIECHQLKNFELHGLFGRFRMVHSLLLIIPSMVRREEREDELEIQYSQFFRRPANINIDEINNSEWHIVNHQNDLK